MQHPKLRAIRALLERMPTDSVTAVQVRQLIANVEAHATALDVLRTNPDPMLSKLAIDLKTESAKQALSAAVEAARAKSAGLVQEYRANLSINQRQQAGLTPDAYAAEIRSVFRGLDAKERNAFMQNAIDGRDSSTLAAVLQSPLAVSGLNAGERDNYLSTYLDAVNPIDSSWIGELETASTTALNAADSLTAE